MFAYGVSLVAQNRVLMEYVVAIIRYVRRLETAVRQQAIIGPGNLKAALVVIIDVFEFNDQGKVNSMKAYWSDDNMKSA